MCRCFVPEHYVNHHSWKLVKYLNIKNQCRHVTGVFKSQVVSSASKLTVVFDCLITLWKCYSTIIRRIIHLAIVAILNCIKTQSLARDFNFTQSLMHCHHTFWNTQKQEQREKSLVFFSLINCFPNYLFSSCSILSAKTPMISAVLLYMITVNSVKLFCTQSLRKALFFVVFFFNPPSLYTCISEK